MYYLIHAILCSSQSSVTPVVMVHEALCGSRDLCPFSRRIVLTNNGVSALFL